ncbi:MAG: T9SS type A sorting domain-containing protein [Ignavibacteriae bacterium]|nr:T9SS type A sorting domain-containing protein [Ignavibacteriota bacterium]
MFEDSTYVVVEDKGPVYYGIIRIAVSDDGHEAEISAPFWGFLKTHEGKNIINLNQNIKISASLEGSGELSEEAVKLGYTPGSKSVWGSNTALPFNYFIKSTEIVSLTSELNLPSIFELKQNYPNPFNPSTTINYTIQSKVKSENANVASEFSLSNVTLKIYDILGREVETLVNENQKPGNYKILFDGSNFPSGVYYYQLKSGNFNQTKKMILAK